MVNAHHDPATKADQAGERGENTAVGPDIKDADFSVGGPGGGVDDGIEGDTLLEEVLAALKGRDGG